MCRFTMQSSCMFSFENPALNKKKKTFDCNYNASGNGKAIIDGYGQ